MKKATFTEMTQGTQEDYVPIVEAAMVHSENLPERIIEHLNMLKDDFGGFAVDRYEHCLQTASRAYRDGRDEEYVVCALLHDIGDILALQIMQILQLLYWSLIFQKRTIGF